jgi:cytochrome c-type biogenesis protein CcmF
MTEASIQRSLTGDLYVALGEAVGDAWTVRVQKKPAVNWIWIGVVMMGVGGFWAAADARYRRRVGSAAALPFGPSGNPR